MGGAICGALAFGIWPEMWKSYGIMGGWLAAAIVISICWYMNHWIGMIWNEPGRIWVDQGWAVSSAGIAWAMVRFNSEFRQCLPTVVCCLIGRRPGRHCGGAGEEAPSRLPARRHPAKERRSPMYEWMSHYVDWLGMSPVSVLTTVFGAFCVTFVVIICWGRLVEDFGPIGGMMAAGIIIGTFWVMNHKLPGFGINPEGIPHPEGGSKQFGLIYQGFRGRGAVGGHGHGHRLGPVGLRVVRNPPRPQAARPPRNPCRGCWRPSSGASSAAPSSGLIGWTGANLFG